MSVLIYFRKVSSIRDLTVMLTALFFGSIYCSGVAFSENNYSLGNSDSTGLESQDVNMDKNIDGAGNYLDTDPTDLFGNQPSNSAQDPVHSSVLPGASNDPAARPDIKAGGASPSNNLVPTPIPVPPPTNMTNAVPVSLPPVNAGNQAVDPQKTNLSAAAAAPENSQTTIVTPELSTDGSVAPVKVKDPLAPNEFGGAPPLPGSRKNLARGDAPEVYTVESGDTMFDICSQIIDDGNYWPKLWSLNADVKNPHFIFPGMKLAFFSGDAQTPPYLEVVEEDDMLPVDKGPLQEADLIANKNDVPEYFDTPANVGIPADSSPDVNGPEDLSVNGLIDDLFVSGGGSYSGTSVTLTIPAFIFPEEREELGQVLSGMRNEVNAGDDVMVRVEAQEGLANGTIYTVLRYRGEVNSPVTGDFVGYRYDFAANIKILKSLSDDQVEGQVINSQFGVRRGDILVNYLSTKRTVDSFNVTGSLSQSDAAVVGLDMFTQTFAGDGGIIFLDKGGLQQGGFFSVYQKDSNTSVFSRGLDSDNSEGRRVGIVRVIDSNPSYTVAVIIKSMSEIRLGDQLKAR